MTPTTEALVVMNIIALSIMIYLLFILVIVRFQILKKEGNKKMVDNFYGNNKRPDCSNQVCLVREPLKEDKFKKFLAWLIGRRTNEITLT